MNFSFDNCWVLIAAAGSGSRMQSSTPKQYLPLAGKPVLQHGLERFLSWSGRLQIALVTRPDSPELADIGATRSDRVHIVEGGATRAESVLSGLQFIANNVSNNAAAETAVLIHDAARPLVRKTDVQQLLEMTSAERREGRAVGGILATPATDTIKLAENSNPGQAGGQLIMQTMDRERLWQARTPQLFLLEELLQAMTSTKSGDSNLKAGGAVAVTDEASAMEQAGHRVLMVKCHSDNIKITRAEDLLLAEALLQLQSDEGGSA